MATFIYISTILVPLGALLDFILGEKGNKKLRDRLADFYVAIEEGDWDRLYKGPAIKLLLFFESILSNRVFSIKFFLKTLFISVIFTFVMVFSYIFLSYLKSIWNDSDSCRAPPFYLALGVPFYLAPVMIKVFFINFIFDLLTWSATIWFLRKITSGSRKYHSFVVVIGVPLSAFLVIRLLHAIYLPVSLDFSTSKFGIPFGSESYIQFGRNGLLLPLMENFEFRSFLTLRCYSPPTPPFSFSIIALTQYAALEALIPLILFTLSCFLGATVYWSRGITLKPVALVVERLAVSKNVCVTLAVLVSAIVAILKVLFGS
ncbi:hypothetical protein [Rhizobium sp. BK491]|uniref:hypothetical protein n=1 Tax=Rhizobium sp. BK491 TaxID=2587009 RepID=UPI001621FFC7|nr:hypothetical protein [Rhizobium sp. BK491]MBB3571595.1 hypothetical protein [Rhizobium sp. BK491]